MTATLFALYVFANAYNGANWTQQGVFQSKEHCERAIATLGKVTASRCVDTGIPNGTANREGKAK